MTFRTVLIVQCWFLLSHSKNNMNDGVVFSDLFLLCSIELHFVSTLPNLLYVFLLLFVSVHSSHLHFPSIGIASMLYELMMELFHSGVYYSNLVSHCSIPLRLLVDQQVFVPLHLLIFVVVAVCIFLRHCSNVFISAFLNGITAVPYIIAGMAMFFHIEYAKLLGNGNVLALFVIVAKYCLACILSKFEMNCQSCLVYKYKKFRLNI